nr:ester cyclase [Chloroflexota bacterium]
MAPEENKAIVRRFFEQAWSQGDLSIVDELIATDADNAAPDEMPGTAGIKQFIAMYRAGMP